MRGPPITVKCDCGEATSLRYGDRWQCPSCGRLWNTEQIPREEYLGLVRDLRRYRLLAIAAAVGVLAAYVPLVFLVDEGIIFTAPILLAILAIALGPFWKRRVRRVIAERPRWRLDPE